MNKSLRVSIALMAFALAVSAGYHADVQKVSDFPAGIKVLAVIRVGQCLPNVDCLKLEDHAVKRLQETKRFTVLPMATVRQAMFDLGITEENSTRSAELLEQLGADTLCEIGITAVGLNDRLQATGAIEVRMTRKDGKLLMRGQGYGAKSFGSQKNLSAIKNIFDEIIDKAFKK